MSPLKKIYITTPIFYVNSAPHIGHLYSALLADAYARFQVLKFKDYDRVYFATGTDEHGSKIEKQAFKHQQNPIDFCNEISKKFKSLFDLCDIKYHDFIRTTETRHKQAVEHLWNKIASNGHIYKSTYDGWYSMNDEAFLSDEQVQDRFNKDGTRTKISIESGHAVERTSENNYIFKLTNFKDDLHKYLSKNVIFPANYAEKMYSELDTLRDLSISRDARRLSWGIQVPNDPTQIVYVWMDALTNYLTVAGYPNDEKKMRELWPCDIHVVGKDILKFHAIYWPAFLFAANIEPPRRIVCHGHWLMNNQKMSKSIGNVIDPLGIIDKCTKDGLRYFLLREGVPAHDSNITESKINTLLNAELANTLGNLFQRALSQAINPSREFPSSDNLHFNSRDREFIERLNSLRHDCEVLYEEFKFYDGVQRIMSRLRDANVYFNEKKPWILIKNQNLENKQELDKTYYLVFETIRVTSILLQPIIPNISAALLNYLNVPQNERFMDNAVFNEIKKTSTSITHETNTIFKRIEITK